MTHRSSGVLVGEGLRADGVLIQGPAPVGDLWIPLTGGLTVLYGRNGAGKTTVLRAVESALRGVALPGCRASVHLSMDDEIGGFDDRLLKWFRHTEPDWAALDFDLDVNNPEADDESEDGPDHADESALDEQIEIAVQGLRRYLVAVGEKYGLAEGRCHTPRIELVAVGTSDDPRWDAFVSVVPTDMEEFARNVGAHDDYWVRARARKRDGDVAAGTGHMYAALITEDGWQALPLPVAVEQFPLVGAEDDVDGLPSRGLIACLTGSDRLDVNGATLDFVRSVLENDPDEGLLGSMNAAAFEPTERVGRLLGDLSANATFALRTFTGLPARLRVDLCHPNRWIDGDVVRWTGTDSVDLELPIERLGAGSGRWARLSISLALASPSALVPAIILMDEPERALHSAAQIDVARAFAATAESGDLGRVEIAAVMVATHSAAFLSIAGVNLVHVVRNTANRISLEPIDTTVGVEGLTAQLGISRPDALLTTRCFMFVEGDHDEAVLRTLFSGTLRDRHVALGTMDGAANISAYVTAQHLLAYSDARIRVVLDALGKPTTNTWEAARAAAASGDRDRARRSLESLKRSRKREAQWLYEAGIAALERNQLDRIEVVCLSRPDIMNYLPVEAIVPSASDWGPLFAEYQIERHRGSFKDWLKRSKGARFDARSLGEIAATVTNLADLPSVVDGL